MQIVTIISPAARAKDTILRAREGCHLGQRTQRREARPANADATTREDPVRAFAHVYLGMEVPRPPKSGRTV